MPDTKTGQDAPALTAAEAQSMREEIATLRAAEERRNLTDTLGALRFSEGREVLAPASRTALTEALMGVPAGNRQAVIDALKGVQFAELGERGYTAGEPQDPDTVTEERKAELLRQTPLGQAVAAK